MQKKLYIILLVLVLFGLSAQENKSKEKILIDFSVDLSNEEQKYFEYSEVITTAFRVAFEDDGYVLINKQETYETINKAKAAGEKMLLSDYALNAGKLAEADYVFTGFIKSDGYYIVFKLKVFDVKTGVQLFSGIKNSVLGPGIYTQVDDLISETVDVLENSVNNLSENLAKERVFSYSRTNTVIPKNIVLKSPDEGAVVRYKNGPVAGEINDGKLILSAVPGSVLDIEIEKENYHTAYQKIRIKDKKDTYKLKSLKIEAEQAFQAGWKMLKTDGFTFGYVKYIDPGKTFVALSSGFYYRDAEINQTQMFLDERIRIGAYLPGTEDNLLRLSFSTGPGIFFTGVDLEDSNDWYADFYWTYLEYSIEFNFKKYSFFISTSLDYYPEWGDSGLPREYWDEGIDFDGMGPYLHVGVMRKW